MNRSFIIEQSADLKTWKGWLCIQSIFLGLQYMALRVVAEFSDWVWNTSFDGADTLLFLVAVKIASLTLTVRWVNRD